MKCAARFATAVRPNRLVYAVFVASHNNCVNLGTFSAARLFTECVYVEEP